MGLLKNRLNQSALRFRVGAIDKYVAGLLHHWRRLTGGSFGCGSAAPGAVSSRLLSRDLPTNVTLALQRPLTTVLPLRKTRG